MYIYIYILPTHSFPLQYLILSMGSTFLDSRKGFLPQVYLTNTLSLIVLSLRNGKPTLLSHPPFLFYSP